MNAVFSFFKNLRETPVWQRLKKWHFFVIVPVLVYGYSVSPTIGFGDTAIIIDGAKRLVLSTHANNHNLTLFIVNLFTRLPMNNLALAANLASAFLGSVAVIMFYFLLYRQFKSRLVAAFAAGVLMLSQSMWWHSTMVESYAFNAIFVVGALWLIDSYRRAKPERQLTYLYILFTWAGLSIANHIQLGTLIAAAGWLVLYHIWKNRRNLPLEEGIRIIGYSFASLVAGLIPYLLVFSFDVSRYGLKSSIFSAAGWNFQSLMFKGKVLHQLSDNAYLVFQQFPSPFLILIWFGLLLFFRKWRLSGPTQAILLIFLMNTLFFSFYSTWDKYAFMLPSYIILAFWGGFAADLIMRGIRKRRQYWLRLAMSIGAVFCLVSPPYFYANASEWAKSPDSIFRKRYATWAYENIADPVPYILNPNKHGYEATDVFCRLILVKLPPKSIYADDDSRAYYMLNSYYRQFYHYRPDLDLRLINSWGFSGWGMTQNDFINLLDYAYFADRDFFLSTLYYPYDSVINQARGRKQHPFNFVKYELDATHWVYKLVTVKDDTAYQQELLAYKPEIIDLKVGLDFNTMKEKPQNTLRKNDKIMAKTEFKTNQKPFAIYYRWYEPNGKLYFQSSTSNNYVPIGNTGTWSFLEYQGKELPAGSWRVEVYINGIKAREKSFAVE